MLALPSPTFTLWTSIVCQSSSRLVSERYAVPGAPQTGGRRWYGPGGTALLGSVECDQCLRHLTAVPGTTRRGKFSLGGERRARWLPWQPSATLAIPFALVSRSYTATLCVNYPAQVGRYKRVDERAGCL